ncbi:carboxylesterase family protein [Microbacter sp. GSS18]|nr:carboxylesterase family protein [Microbacter sp. GSS18]
MTSLPPTSTTEVDVSTGRIRGTAADGIRRFLGIPYAEPPFGERRFRAPEPRAPWEGTLDAIVFGPAAPQTPYRGAVSELLPSVEAWGEDCLTVNVWSPDAAAAAPVVVWIHGGAFERGAPSLAGYDGTPFARDGVVFVSINYRLGSEGFSVLDGAPRNVGLRDAALALEWVHREIAAFGGDPDRITLMGESAGGSIVAALLSMPDSARLVARGVIESGPLEVQPPERAGRVTRDLAKRLGVEPTRAGFASVPPGRLLEVRAEQAAGSNPLQGAPGFQPTIDPDSLPVSPHEALVMSDVPLLIGANTDEYRLWFAPEVLAGIGGLKSWVARTALRIPRAATRAARAEWPDASPGELLGQLVTDRMLRAPLTHLAGARSAPTHVFEFAWQSPVRDLRAGHAVELGFVFDALAESTSLSGPDAPQHLADEMHRAWVDFIIGGDPGWEPYGTGRAVRVFDVESSTVPQPRASIVDALR